MDEKRIELAAREVCKMRGLDPDATVIHDADPSPNGWVPDICMASPLWTRVAREVRQHVEIQEAFQKVPPDTKKGG